MQAAVPNSVHARENASRIADNAPVVLGIGNVLLGDDGTGVAVAESLRAELSAWGVTVVDGGTLSYSLLSLIEDTGELIAIDAGNTDSRPGTIEVFEGAAMDDYLGRRASGTVHEIGLRDLLDMARLRDALPAHRALVVIQPGSVEWGSSLTPEVESAVPAAAEEVRGLLVSWS